MHIIKELELYQGTWALVTGASSGIGAEFCRQLARHQIHIILVARREDRLKVLADELSKLYQIQCLVIPCDLSLVQAARDLKEKVESRNIKIKILVNNAGYGPWGHFARLQEEECQRVLQLLFNTPAQLIRCFLDHLLVHKNAVVINVTSQAALQPIPYLSIYSAAKVGLHHLSLALYEEFRLKNIYFQTLIPSPTKTEFDSVGKAYPCGLSDYREFPEKIVSLSLKSISKKPPVVTTVSFFQLLFQRIFNGIFPYAFIVKKIGQVFSPPNKNEF